METPLPAVSIYTDGSHIANYKVIGPVGGWAAVMVNPDGRGSPHIISGHSIEMKSSGCMEALAVTHALNSLDTPYKVGIYTDDKQLAQLIRKYSEATPADRSHIKADYLDPGDRRITGENRQVLGDMLDALEPHTVHVIKVQAHSNDGHRHSALNNLADEKAKQARDVAMNKLNAILTRKQAAPITELLQPQHDKPRRGRH